MCRIQALPGRVEYGTFGKQARGCAEGRRMGEKHVPLFMGRNSDEAVEAEVFKSYDELVLTHNLMLMLLLEPCRRDPTEKLLALLRAADYPVDGMIQAAKLMEPGE